MSKQDKKAAPPPTPTRHGNWVVRNGKAVDLDAGKKVPPRKAARRTFTPLTAEQKAERKAQRRQAASITPAPSPKADAATSAQTKE